MFMRIFVVEAKALEFAAMVKGVLSVRYDWDSWKQEIVKEYVVKW